MATGLRRVTLGTLAAVNVTRWK